MEDRQLSADGRFRWSEPWQQWVPTGREETIDAPPLKMGPLEPEKPRHPRRCWCAECWNEGLRVGEYLRNRNLWGNGGLS